MEALGLEQATSCNWNSGIDAVYDDWLGFAQSSSPRPSRLGIRRRPAAPAPVGRGFIDKCAPLLVDLGGHFDEVQYFFSFPPIDYFAWARVQDGRLVRAFAVSDEGIVWNKGRPSKEERALGLKLFELRGVRGRKGDAGGEIILHPTEEHVMRLASRWSIDPTTLYEEHAPQARLYRLTANWLAVRATAQSGLISPPCGTHRIDQSLATAKSSRSLPASSRSARPSTGHGRATVRLVVRSSSRPVQLAGSTR